MPSIYPLDYTGTANSVVGEIAIVPSGVAKLIVPEHGAFFEEGVTVRSGGTVLVPFIDYTFVHPVANVIRLTKLPAFLALAITKPGVTQVTFDYHPVGGDYSLTLDQVNALQSGNINASISYSSLLNLPLTFPPVYHMHAAEDISFDGLKQVLDEISRAIEVGSAGSLGALYNYVRNLTGTLELEYDLNTTANLHGSIRHKVSGLTICFGKLDTSQSSLTVSRQIFRRQFLVKPLVISGGLDVFAAAANGTLGPQARYTVYNVTVASFNFINVSANNFTNEPTLVQGADHLGYIAIGYTLSNAAVSDVQWTRSSYPQVLL